jgi:hypothetical protein
MMHLYVAVVIPIKAKRGTGKQLKIFQLKHVGLRLPLTVVFLLGRFLAQSAAQSFLSRSHTDQHYRSRSQQAVTGHFTPPAFAQPPSCALPTPDVSKLTVLVGPATDTAPSLAARRCARFCPRKPVCSGKRPRIKLKNAIAYIRGMANDFFADFHPHPPKFAKPNSQEAREYYESMKKSAETRKAAKAKQRARKSRPITLENLWQLMQSLRGTRN